MSQDARQTTGTFRGRPGALATLAALALAAACDTLPSEPEVTVGAMEELAAVQEVWPDLPSTLEMEAQALAASHEGWLEGEAVHSLLEAGALAAEAEVAVDLGMESDATPLLAASDTLATRALLGAASSLDPEVVLDRVEGALVHVQTRIGARARAEARAHLRDAEEALHRGRSARSAGDRASTLLHAGRAADALRWLDPEAKATAAVAAARVILDRAQAVAGDEPEPPIARALTAAAFHCAAAGRALDAERWRLAVTEAHACARISRAVIARLSGGVDADTLGERADEAVANAGALFHRASEMAGPRPGARIEALLLEAEGLLGRARFALGEERYRMAIAFAIESSARSVRVLRILHHDDTSPYELRAKASVEIALALSARVAAQMDDSTSPELVEAAHRADALLEEARAELDDGAWRSAWGKARTTITVYTRILLALS